MLIAVSLGKSSIAQQFSQPADRQPLREWSLEDCIQYAILNNVQLNQSKLDLSLAENNLQQAKNNRLPVLAANTVQQHSTGRTIDPITSDFINTRLRSTSLATSANITLWNGGYLKNDIDKNKLILVQNQFFVDRAKNDIVLTTIQAYMTALNLYEGIAIAKKTIANALEQYRTAKGRHAVGTLSSIDLSTYKAQLSTDTLTLINAENTYRSQVLQLKQLLEIPPDSTFDIQKIALQEEMYPIPAAAELYSEIKDHMPETKLSRLDLHIKETELKLAKSGYYPKLSLRGGMTTGYTNTQFFGFANQLQNNFSPNVSLDITIPIFTQFTNRTNVKNAKLAIQRATLDIKKQDRELYSTLESVIQEARSAHAQLNAARDAEQAAALSYQLANRKNRLGALSLGEFIVIKNEYLNAADKYLQAKLTFALYQKLISFYQTQTITDQNER